MPHFPFIVVPPSASVDKLRHVKPFLFLAILSVACFHDLNTQDKLCHRFKYMVSERVLLGGDDCLQLEYLQGLLIVLAWYTTSALSVFCATTDDALQESVPWTLQVLLTVPSARHFNRCRHAARSETDSSEAHHCRKQARSNL